MLDPLSELFEMAIRIARTTGGAGFDPNQVGGANDQVEGAEGSDQEFRTPAEQRAADLIKDEGVLTEAASIQNKMGQAEIAFRDDPIRNVAMRARAHALQAQFNAKMGELKK